MIWMYGTEEEYNEGAKKFVKQGKTLKDVKRDLFMGTPEVLVEKLRQAKDLGLDHLIFYVRPKGSVEVAKQNLAEFKDKVIDRV